MQEISTRDKILDSAFILLYEKGYHGMSTSMVLKACAIPKGSLYHFFPSKKALALSVLQERIEPKMKAFFSFEFKKGELGIEAVKQTLFKIANTPMLIQYGCPLHRMHQEMAGLDADFDKETTKVYQEIKARLIHCLKQDNLQQDNNALASFIMGSIWGSISLSPANSSKEQYLANIQHLCNYLDTLK